MALGNAKRKRKHEENGVVVEGLHAEDGANDPNAVLIVRTKRKKEKTEDKKQTKYNLKRERMREMKAARLTKKKRRQLAAVQQRREAKDTRDDLLAELSKVQATLAETANLAPVTQLRRKRHKKDAKEDVLPKLEYADPAELNVVKKKIIPIQTIHNQKPVQLNYYETDSEDDDSNESDDDEDTEEKEPTPDVSEPPEPEVVEEPEVKVEEPKPKTQPTSISRISTAFNLKPVIISTRSEEIEAQRSKLPIYKEEQMIVEAINENPATIVAGETGSGKTTQIPQFLYEAGYAVNGLIGITEPRRVAAVAMAKRVGLEMGLPNEVSFQIRFESSRTDDTKILFMTDGVLLREMQSDRVLQKFSVIIIDEAHERSVYSDVLIALLSRIVIFRADSQNPLKLIIMSATMRTSDFMHKRLFPTIEPKLISVESRQFPVTVHFEKRTPENFMEAAFTKACRVHEELPEGAMLIFVPGQADVKFLIRLLSSRYPMRHDMPPLKATNKKEIRLDDFKEQNKKAKSKKQEDFMEGGVGDDDISDGDDNDDYDERAFDTAAMHKLPPPRCQSLFCLPMYSLLSSEKQRRIFDDPPAGSRLCVISTNVAETSLTIPGVRYVIDTGFEKRRAYDAVTGVSKFETVRCSQASAEQRSGRAGRVSAGHAYRLYSSQVFQDLNKFSMPEILNTPIDQLVLRLKNMNVVRIVNFPFPTPPESDAIEAAETRLVKLNALKRVTSAKGETEAKITSFGKILDSMPLSPAYAKVVAMANQQNLMPFAISLISVLSVREPLVNIATLRMNGDEKSQSTVVEIMRLRNSWISNDQLRSLGDLTILLRSVTESEKCGISPGDCEQKGIRHKAMKEVRKMRTQLTNIINASFNSDTIFNPILDPPGKAEAQLIRQLFILSLPDRIAKKVVSSGDDDVPKGAYQSQVIKEFVFIDATSMLYPKQPDYVLYQDIVQIGKKKCMQNVMAVEEAWIGQLAENYCTFGKVDELSEIRYDPKVDALVSSVSINFGPLFWELPRMERPLPINIKAYRLFAQFLLDGKIIKAFSKYTSKMLAPAVTMTRAYAKLQPRTEAFLNALIKEEILSKAELLSVWKTNKFYLLDEYLAWLPQSLHDKVQLEWPFEDEKQ